eukprot:CAMPEP_0202702160 /NCGR_PEP_ID=MMETSP1385-20130828/15183_1 /ASSEMBLY_ACC=CAM_ASM_000861 /TAXON_ID=933848 /ORGANISM="Elphidium margaritaceum" /LENGTH=611 /DNA_ID=CAMNT_0049359753 /DNA_START=51 /DNA_END=1886 /DNA_ORIENTATION=+
MDLFNFDTQAATQPTEEKQEYVPMSQVIQNVQSMVYDAQASAIVHAESLSITNVTWEDCARDKFSVWGPCISDMTLQVNEQRMPVIRQPNYTDKTWDVELDKIPVIVGNESPNPGAATTTISLRQYLENFSEYMTTPKGNTLNLIANDPFAKQSDKHVIMSSQCCFLPIEKGKETRFNVALFNYQSKKDDPAVLVIVSTSKGTSAQIIQGNEQKLLFNNFGQKADFIGQRLTDNRIERNVSIHGAMTKQEKQDNCIVIIQVPLKQKPKPVFASQYQQNFSWGGSFGAANGGGAANDFFAGSFGVGAPPIQQQQQQLSQQQPMATSCSNSNAFSRFSAQKYSSDPFGDAFGSHQKDEKASANVEAAIVKIATKTVPTCTCGQDLCEKRVRECYGNHGGGAASTGVSCDGCGQSIQGLDTKVWHCTQEKSAWTHANGYDLCLKCGEEQLKFDELDGLDRIERDTRYPIRVTLQYYKSTDNGVLTTDIMKAIKKLLTSSQKQADFIGSLVTDFTQRSTEPDLQTKNEVVVIQPPQPVLFFAPYGKHSKIVAALQQINVTQNEWKTYLKKFQEEDVADDDLASLSQTDLHELIPKMGPRNRFKKYVEKEYKIIIQ